MPLFDHRGNAKKILEAISKTRYEFINGMPTYNLVDTLAQAENDRMKMVELNCINYFHILYRYFFNIIQVVQDGEF